MSKIKVDIKEKSKSYEVIVGSNVALNISKYLKEKKPSKIVLITDTFVDSLYGNLLRRLFNKSDVISIAIPQGEQYKTLYTVSAIYDQMIKKQVNRDSLVVALGGGVVGDVAGFVASTYMRGLPVIQVPTTLLSQVDASIGGKTGVDHSGGKNLIGAFYQPELVVCDIEFLRTLSPRELKTGLSEVVKYAIIKDIELFSILEKNPKADASFWEDIISRCARTKAEVVSKDEKEKTGLRMILNLGHTIGHAIESVTKYETFTHGEAVALGMVAASYISYYMKLLKKPDLERIINLILKIKLPIVTDLDSGPIIKALTMDKKAKAGKVRFILPVKIGKVIVKDNVSTIIIKKALKEIGCK